MDLRQPGFTLLLPILVLFLQASDAVPQIADKPGTVLITYRVKSSFAEPFAATLNTHWPTLRKLDLVLPQPHIVVRGQDDRGRWFFTELLTWRNHDIPDHVPPEIQAIWTEMQQMVEQRDGHDGIEFPEVEILTAVQ